MAYEEWRARKKAEEETLRNQLFACDMDGPYEVQTGNMFDGLSMFNPKSLRYAICKLCGAMVKLDDPIDLDGINAERGVYLHTNFHISMLKGKEVAVSGNQDS